MTTLLMCPPTNFAVLYDINPWMTKNVGLSTPNALRQWERLVETLLEDPSVTIELVQPHPSLPDLVFTANAALISGRTAIVSTFRHPQRQLEEERYRERLAGLGFRTTAVEGAFFEGAGDALFDRVDPLLYVGYGWRSDHSATSSVAEMAETEIVPLRLVDPRFYHLDTCLCPLQTGHVLAFMGAFSAKSQAQLRATVGHERLIEVSERDAEMFACNAIDLGDTIVMHDASQELRERLNGIGYRVRTTDLSDFHRSGGSAKCLTLKLEDGPVKSAPMRLRATG